MEQRGKAIDKVALEIDYNIIEHFSKHLYSSPTKAVEELVANGYDAAATQVSVFLPGSFTDKVIIWDNGYSMDVSGLKDLWKVADSPKNSDDSREITLESGSIRKVIGKFGIGKIASYTIGNQIRHICKSNGEFLSVGVNYIELMNGAKNKTQASANSPIYQLTEDDAKILLTSSFNVLPENFDIFFSHANWTFAIIDQLKSVSLSAGRIKWVLGNGMPIQPYFSVSLNQEPIVPNILKDGLVCEWDFGQTEVVEHIQSKWNEAVQKGKVSGQLDFGAENHEDSGTSSYVLFPELGKVWGKIRLYTKSLLDNRVSDHGRSHGFFIIVRGRLINQDDALFFLNDPSFATFYSSQFLLYVDGIDSELLADRERVQEVSQKSKELEVLQRAVYLTLAAKQRKVVEELVKDQSIQHRLPVRSPEFFLDPLAALWIKSGSNKQLGFDFKDPKIDSKALGQDNSVAKFSSDNGFSVNSEHPYYQNLTKLGGNGKQAKKFVKEFEVIAVSEKLFEGYLFELGISEDIIDQIMDWRDRMYRELAKSDKQNFNQIAQNLRETSYTGGGSFENAIVDLLNAIGFNAKRDGASGQKDVFVNAYCGEGSYRLTFEAKGSKSAVKNDAAETGGANSHRVAAGAEHAVILARTFAGFEKGDSPAILQECLRIGNVSIMEVEGLILLAHAVLEYSYSLEGLKDIFTAIESPREKIDRIKSLDTPLHDFDYGVFLNRVKEDQELLGRGKAIALRTLWQKHYYEMEEQEMLHKVEALRTLAYPLIQYNEANKEIALMQSPDNIIQLIQNKFHS